MNYCGALCILRFQLYKKKKKRKEKEGDARGFSFEDISIMIRGGSKKGESSSHDKKKKEKRGTLFFLLYFFSCGSKVSSSYLDLICISARVWERGYVVVLYRVIHTFFIFFSFFCLLSACLQESEKR